jgi:DNA-binding CsgD family transcriptional regulator
MVETLGQSLKPVERAVLTKLADGLSTAEIARLLGLSCPTVTKHRRKIARVAQNLDRLPLLTGAPEALLSRRNA